MDSKEAAVQVANETVVDLLRAVMDVSEPVESTATGVAGATSCHRPNQTRGVFDARMTQRNSALVQDDVAGANALEIQSQQLRRTARVSRYDVCKIAGFVADAACRVSVGKGGA